MAQALRGSGDYELSRDYLQFKIRPDTWYQLPESSQKNKLNSFLKHPPKRSEQELKNITDTINSRLKESQKSKKIKKE